MNARIGAVHPVLKAGDVDVSVQFYRCLGFEVVFQDAATNPNYVALRRDAVELHLQWADEKQWAYPIDHPAYRFLVDDVDGLYDEFKARGGAGLADAGSPWSFPKATPWGTREFHVRDPGRNSLQFFQAV
jgi:hypothetical protein